MPTFQPKDPRDLALQNLLPKGEYDFEVKLAKDAISKSSGREMIELRLAVFSGDRQFWVTDYLVFSEGGMSKIFGFCQATGIEAKYQAGKIAVHDVQGLCGKVIIKIDDSSPEFEPKNAVARYKKPSAPKPVAAPAALRPEDDHIPF
jgi:hypothetical protein